MYRMLTCEPKDPGTPDPWGSDAQQPENAFRRIANLQAFTRRPITRWTFWANRVIAHRFAFCPPVPRVRRCFGLFPG